MDASRKFALLIPMVACGLLTVGHAAPAVVDEGLQSSGNSYYVYTKSLDVDKSGVAQVPSRYRWSVETSWSGIDVKGNDLPDSRVMLRLHDPDQNFTALTAQMDLDTAVKLQKELAEIIAKKQQDPAFQHRPQLYDSTKIPRMTVVGVDENGVAIVKEVADE